MGVITHSCDHHTHFFPNEEGTPTKEEINIFRLWKNPDCGRWVSLIGEVKDGKAYREIEAEGFDKAYGNIVWPGKSLL